MKKNILTIVIMAATLINLVLSAVMIFSVVPAMNKTSNLVDKVASVVDLEIEDANKDAQDYTVEDLKPFEVKYDTSLKINLQKDSGDETLHMQCWMVLWFLLTQKQMIMILFTKQ